MIPTADELLDACRRVGLTWGQAGWLADLPPTAGPDDLTADDRRRVGSAIAASLPGVPVGGQAGERRGMCLPAEIDAEQEQHNRLAIRRERMTKALWLVAVGHSRRANSGPSLFDTGDEEDPASELRRKWAEWQALDGDTSPYELAWLIGACRVLGIRVEDKGGKPNLLPGGRPSEVTEPLLGLLRKHRPAVVAQVAAGLPFDSVDWQVELVQQAAGEWPVWGYRVGGVTADRTRESLLPVIPHDRPPFYDVLRVYRPDCFRAITADPVLALRSDREIGWRLSPGMVYVGPAMEGVPEGKGGALAEERKIRQRNGHPHNPIFV